MKLDFFARRAHYIDHMAPVWNALPTKRRGRFHIAQELETYAEQELHGPYLEIFKGGVPSGDNPILTAAYGDLNKVVRNPDRQIITMEHGVTQGFQTAAYPNATIGNRARVDLALLPNVYVARRFRAVRETPCEVIGTPKMDEWVPMNWPGGTILFNRLPDLWSREKITIAIAFHWGDKHSNPPESGSAFEHYRTILPALAARYKVIGHAHPLASPSHQQAFEQAGIEWVGDFREVLERADVYLNDLSSTMYEFLVTGKPVIILNAPWFRREMHWGIRFWDYSDVGLMVEHPDEVIPAIDRTLAEYGTICAPERRRAVTDLYPYAGHSAYRAAEVITAYLEKLEKAEHA